MQYIIKAICGHEWTANIYGDKSYREWLINKYEGELCPECEEIEKNRKNEENIKIAKQMELPDLIGTERQVRWANELRLKILREVWGLPEKYGSKKIIRSMNDILRCGPDPAEFVADFQRINYRKGENESGKPIYDFDKLFLDVTKLLMGETKAGFWIENRDMTTYGVLAKAMKKLARTGTEIPEDVIIEGLLTPETSKHSGRVLISEKEKRIEARYSKDDEFRKIIKNHGFKWDQNAICWYRILGVTTGTFEDRAAELAHDLLEEGFSVYLPDETIREKAIEGTYEPEYKRWIARLANEEKLLIKTGGDQNLYQVAKKLPGAYWESGTGLLVSPMHYKEVLDFAQAYEYHMSPGAKQLIHRQEQIDQSAEIVSVKKKENSEPNEEGLRKILQSSDQILEDLKDE